MSGKEVKEILLKSGYKLSEIADMLNVTPQTLQSRFNAKSINLDFLNNLCQVLNKDISFFYKGNDDSEPSGMNLKSAFVIIDNQQQTIDRLSRIIENLTNK